MAQAPAIMNSPAKPEASLAFMSSKRSSDLCRISRRKSMVQIVETALIELDSELIAAARQAAMITPPTPGHISVRMKWGSTSSGFIAATSADGCTL